MWLTKAGQNELEACLRASDLLVAQAGQDGLSVLLAGSETVAKFYEQVQRAENASVTEPTASSNAVSCGREHIM